MPVTGVPPTCTGTSIPANSIYPVRRTFLVAALSLVAVGCSGDKKVDPLTGHRLEPPKITRSPVHVAGDASHDHVEGPLDYTTTKYHLQDQAPPAPPLGGAHNPKWLRCGVYDAPVPNEYAVHSLEHGAAWVTYRPGLPAEQIRQLAALSELNDVSREYMLVSPYEGIPAPIVLAAWGVWLTFDNPADPELAAYAMAYSGGAQGGKPRDRCRTDGVTPEQAEQELNDWCRRHSPSAATCAARDR